MWNVFTGLGLCQQSLRAVTRSRHYWSDRGNNDGEDSRLSRYALFLRSRHALPIEASLSPMLSYYDAVLLSPMLSKRSRHGTPTLSPTLAHAHAHAPDKARQEGIHPTTDVAC